MVSLKEKDREYLFIGFCGILVFNHLYILPSLGSLLKIRIKFTNNKKGINQNKLSVNADLNSISFVKYLKKSW